MQVLNLVLTSEKRCLFKVFAILPLFLALLFNFLSHHGFSIFSAPGMLSALLVILACLLFGLVFYFSKPWINGILLALFTFVFIDIQFQPSPWIACSISALIGLLFIFFDGVAIRIFLFSTTVMLLSILLTPSNFSGFFKSVESKAVTRKSSLPILVHIVLGNPQ